MSRSSDMTRFDSLLQELQEAIDLKAFGNEIKQKVRSGMVQAANQIKKAQQAQQKAASGSGDSRELKKGETPDQFKTRVGRCPAGYWQDESGKCITPEQHKEKEKEKEGGEGDEPEKKPASPEKEPQKSGGSPKGKKTGFKVGHVPKEISDLEKELQKPLGTEKISGRGDKKQTK